ncbi:helix-turn-helix domain-containing protein [Paenibacillus sp. GCM10027626]|uniref:helix-turn-helix domain-containing protein n=1 Tax=Paenibacillus sp. GCM10027626 TaxID=3273411 RepID=UPI003639EA13
MKSKLFQYQAYRSMLLSFIFLTSVIVALICVTLFTLFAHSSSRDVGKISESMLAQTSYAANIIEEQVYEIGNHLLSNRTMVTSIYSQKVDYIEEFHTVNALKTIEATYPFIEFIGLYNGYTERYINSKGITAQYEHDLLQQLNGADKKVYGMFFPRILNSPGLGGEKRLLTFVLQPGFNSYLPKKGAIVINVNADYMKQLIGGLQNKSSQYLIAMNTEGVVLSHSKGGHFLEDFRHEDYIKRILQENADAGSFSAAVDGQKSLVSFVKSEQLHWYFVSVSPVKDLFFNLNNVKTFTLTVAFIIFGIGIFMSIWLTNQMYNPIQRLYQKITGTAGGSRSAAAAASKRINEFYMIDETYSSIARKVAEMEPAVAVARKSSLFKYLTGGQSDLTNRFSEPLTGPYFNVIVLSIDGLQQFKQDHSEQMQSLIRFGICNIAGEWMAGDEACNGCEIVIINEQEIGILLQMKHDGEPAEMPLRLLEIQRTVQSYFKLSLTVGIGSTHEEPEQIRNAYLQAREMTYKRFFQGPGHIFRDEPATAASNTAELEYPESLERKLIEAIQMNQAQVAVRVIDQFTSSLHEAGYHHVLYMLQQLLTALNKQFNLMGSAASEQRELFARMTFHAVSYETLEAFSADLAALCRSICEQIEAKAKNRNAEVLGTVKAYIDQYYWKPDISVDFLADYVGLTPGYLGKLFKAQYQQSVNDYLKDVRLELSKQLLLKSTEPVQAISEKVGIHNTTYFYTLFRKKYGMSPVQYRNDAILQRNQGNSGPL